MNDTEIRHDLVRLGLFMTAIVIIVGGLKYYDTKNDVLSDFGSKIYNKIISQK